MESLTAYQKDNNTPIYNTNSKQIAVLENSDIYNRCLAVLFLRENDKKGCYLLSFLVQTEQHVACYSYLQMQKEESEYWHSLSLEMEMDDCLENHQCKDILFIGDKRRNKKNAPKHNQRDVFIITSSFKKLSTAKIVYLGE